MGVELGALEHRAVPLWLLHVYGCDPHIYAFDYVGGRLVIDNVKTRVAR